MKRGGHCVVENMYYGFSMDFTPLPITSSLYKASLKQGRKNTVINSLGNEVVVSKVRTSATLEAL